MRLKGFSTFLWRPRAEGGDANQGGRPTDQGPLLIRAHCPDLDLAYFEPGILCDSSSSSSSKIQTCSHLQNSKQHRPGVSTLFRPSYLAGSKTEASTWEQRINAHSVPCWCSAEQNTFWLLIYYPSCRGNQAPLRRQNKQVDFSRHQKSGGEPVLITDIIGMLCFRCHIQLCYRSTEAVVNFGVV